MLVSLYRSKICDISFSGLFDLMTLNTCHMSRSALAFEVGQPIRSDLQRFTADILRHAVTLTFDFLTFSISAVT